MEILFDSRLCGRDFKSYLLYVPDLMKWADAKGLHLVSSPPVSDYTFVQVEALLCAIEREAGKLTNKEAADIVEADDFLKADPNAEDSPRWLVGAEAHRKWRVKLEKAIADMELPLLDYGSKHPIVYENSSTPKGEAVLVASHGGEVEVRPDGHDEKLAALFDPVRVETLEKMFSTTNSKWRGWTDKAKANGLINARQGRAVFNPYKAGIWFVEKGAGGWDMARLYRTLGNNLPARSLDDKHLFTWGAD